MKQVQDEIRRKNVFMRSNQNSLSTTFSLRDNVYRLTVFSILKLIPLKIIEFSTQRHYEAGSR